MTKETFQRYALVTIVVLLAAIASQRLMAYAQHGFQNGHNHDFVVRNVNIESFSDEQRQLTDEANAQVVDARRMAEQGIHMHDGVCELSEEAHQFANEVRQVRDRIRVEIR